MRTVRGGNERTVAGAPLAFIGNVGIERHARKADFGWSHQAPLPDRGELELVVNLASELRQKDRDWLHKVAPGDFPRETLSAEIHG